MENIIMFKVMAYVMCAITGVSMCVIIYNTVCDMLTWVDNKADNITKNINKQHLVCKQDIIMHTYMVKVLSISPEIALEAIVGHMYYGCKHTMLQRANNVLNMYVGCTPAYKA